MAKSDSLDPYRGRTKAESGGAGDAGYAKKPTKNWDDDANYTRPKPCPAPYGPTDDFYKSDGGQSGY